jgi:hypothetical protein
MPDPNDTADLGIRRSFIEDVDWLAPRLRDADINEVKASMDWNPEQALIYGFYESSVCMSAVRNNKPFVMFGVVEVEPEVGAIWLLGSSMIETSWVFFLRKSKLWLDVLHKDYPLLFNYVDQRNEVHIRYLKWLGFTFINLHPQFGAGKLPFYEFVRIR